MRVVVASADLTSEMTGVIPLPALKATRSPWPAVRRKKPAGLATSTTSPGARWSFNQLDTTPPVVRLTVTRSSASTAGEEDME